MLNTVFLCGARNARMKVEADPDAVSAVISVTVNKTDFSKFPSIQHIKIHVLDMPLSNLLDYFDFLHNFMVKQPSDKKVIVHCESGISRSATIVAAYVMKQENLDVRTALEKIQEHFQNPLICPNDGFKEQLQLYQSMKYKIVATDWRYRLFRQVCLEPFPHTEVYASDHGDADSGDFETAANSGTRCRICRTPLRCSAVILNHSQGQIIDWRISSVIENGRPCAETIVLVDPSPSVGKSFSDTCRDLNHDLDGKVKCGKCRSLVGKIVNRKLSQVCPCGATLQDDYKVVALSLKKVDISL